MRVKTFVQFAKEIEVSVNISDVLSSIAAMGEGDQTLYFIDCINAVHNVLREISQTRIDALTADQRMIIGDALRRQADRYGK